jgi:hypothetical protein
MVVLALVARPTQASESAIDPKKLPPELMKLARETQRLGQLAELASGDDFYLLLDPAKATLQLQLRGVVLREYSVRGITVGRQRVRFRMQPGPSDWESRVWKDGSLDPVREDNRIEIIPPKPDANGNLPEPEPVHVPLPEEKVAPSDFCVRFTEGFSLEVASPGPEIGPGAAKDEPGFFGRIERGVNGWWASWRRFLNATPDDRLRLRVTLDQNDARALYRSLPPGVGLLVLLPTES